MPIRITGLNSGLDTETIISALVSSYKYKTEKYTKTQTKLSWKQEKWKELNAKIYSLYQSVGNLRFSNAYNLKKAKVSDSTKASVKAGSGAPVGTQKLNVLQIAQAGYLSGGKLDKDVTAGTTLAELGYTGGDGKINVTMGDGTTKQITVSQGMTVNDFVNSLKDAGLSANFDAANHRIYVTSKDTGVDNDFTLTGANSDGISALTKLGLNVQSEATDATYTSYTKYYNADGSTLSQNVVDAIEAYREAQEKLADATAQNANMSGAYGYASAYSAMMDALKSSGLSDKEQANLRTLLGMDAAGRVNSVMDKDGNVYSKTGTDSNGNTIYSDKDGKLIMGVTTHTGSDGKTYTANADGTYTYGSGDEAVTYKSTGKKDADGNTLYADEDGNEITVSSKTDYYKATVREENTGLHKITVGDDTYTENEDGIYVGVNGKKYILEDSQLIEVNDDKEKVDGGDVIDISDAKTENITKTVYDRGAAVDVTRSSDVLTELKEKGGFTDDDISALTANISKVNAYENATDSVRAVDNYSRANIVKRIQMAYTLGGASAVTQEVNKYAAVIAENKKTIEKSQETIEEHQVLADIAKLEKGTEAYNAAVKDFVKQVQDMHEIKENMHYNTDAKKVDGTDAKITLNGIEYESSRNTFSINGLDITAEGVTGEGDENAITITTDIDTQGIYDKIKDFLTQYNALINEINSLYNAPTSKGYEPLTSEEKDAMSDTDIELWEQKIKDSLLRRDDTLSSVMNAMTSAMSKGVQVNGKTYYLSNFGIKTLGYLNAAENQQYAYHIDGDEDDAATSGNADKLMAAIMNDPDTITEFMQGLSKNLYDSVDKMMRSTTLSSVYTVYNDKEMASEYSDYTSLIKKWEEKMTAQEDYWYKKFAAMETALAKLNSQTSALSGLFGN